LQTFQVESCQPIKILRDKKTISCLTFCITYKNDS
jgi:hypothetical protein